MSCVTLMANRSDRRFQTLSPRMAARGRQTDQQNEARGNPSRPGLHPTPDNQAGYMTATEFQIASALQPLTRAGSIYAWRLAALRESHGGVARWLAANHPLDKAQWVKLFKRTFVVTGGEITGEFLISIGYLPGSHDESCPVYAKIAGLKPPWMSQKMRKK